MDLKNVRSSLQEKKKPIIYCYLNIYDLIQKTDQPVIPLKNQRPKYLQIDLNIFHLSLMDSNTKV